MVEGTKLAMKVLAIVLAVAGLYLAVFHGGFMPLNHQSVGLGNNHTIHGAIGVVLLSAGAWLWFKPAMASVSTAK